MPRFSTRNATAGSISDMAEVHAANTTSTKNRVPNNNPPDISPNAIGRLTKTRPGPDAGCRPLANTIGKITIPAISATSVSMMATVNMVFEIEVFFGMYEP